MWYKFCKFCGNRARDTPLRGVYIPHFGQIWVKMSVLGVLHPRRCTDGGEIWRTGGVVRSPPPYQISRHRCNVSPMRGEKPQNRPLSKLNTGRLALPWQCSLDRRSRLCHHQIAWPWKPTSRIKQRVASRYTSKVISIQNLPAPPNTPMEQPISVVGDETPIMFDMDVFT